MELATPPQSPQPKNARLSDVVRKARKRPASAKKTFQSPLEKRSLESHSDVKPWVREAAVYLTHRGDRKRHLARLEEVREIDPVVRKKAERALDKLRRDWNRLEAGDVDRVESDSSDSETGAV